MDFMRGKTIRVPEELRRETASGGSPLVRVTGLEPAHLTAQEPKDTATPLERTFSYLTKPIIARISAVVKWFLIISEDSNVQCYKFSYDNYHQKFICAMLRHLWLCVLSHRQ